MRAAAEVGEVALRIERDRALGRVDELDLVALAFRLEARPRFVPRNLGPRPGPAFCELSPDLLLDPLDVSLPDRLRELEVVVEAVLDRWPDRDLDARVEASHGLREQMRCGVAEHCERVGIVRIAGRQDLDRLAVPERQPQVVYDAVGTDEHRLLGELRPDRARGIEPRGAVGQLELGPVGEDDLHGRGG